MLSSITQRLRRNVFLSFHIAASVFLIDLTCSATCCVRVKTFRRNAQCVNREGCGAVSFQNKAVRTLLAESCRGAAVSIAKHRKDRGINRFVIKTTLKK